MFGHVANGGRSVALVAPNHEQELVLGRREPDGHGLVLAPAQEAPQPITELQEHPVVGVAQVRHIVLGYTSAHTRREENPWCGGFRPACSYRRSSALAPDSFHLCWSWEHSEVSWAPPMSASSSCSSGSSGRPTGRPRHTSSSCSPSGSQSPFSFEFWAPPVMSSSWSTTSTFSVAPRTCATSGRSYLSPCCASRPVAPWAPRLPWFRRREAWARGWPPAWESPRSTAAS